MNLLAQIQTEIADYSGLKVMLPLSGGINSAALLCWLGEEVPEERKPESLHLYYSHFTEHSPDTGKFFVALVRYAQTRFQSVKWKATINSVNRYFRNQKMIPHPSLSPCSRELKVLPARNYFLENELNIELVGYVDSDTVKRGKDKKSRFDRLSAKNPAAHFPILEWSKQDCLDYVKQIIGWYPAIYDLKDERGKDVFSHNNCLPCKNMHPKQLEMVAKYYPQYAARAMETAKQVGGYWGRDENMPEVFMCDVCERLS
jgi:3'-phosphoadenosine 5'-phosphosulfate sulfotransferase (PAPS reductase)/FAD synthetase